MAKATFTELQAPRRRERAYFAPGDWIQQRDDYDGDDWRMGEGFFGIVIEGDSDSVSFVEVSTGIVHEADTTDPFELVPAGLRLTFKIE